jgi:hypothetical protein
MDDDFPDDENGRVLKMMLEQGDDLSISRDIDFSVVFLKLENAAKFGESIQKIGLNFEIIEADVDRDFNWDVTVTRNMVPEYSAICHFEQSLQSLSASLDGWNDGWGCLSMHG